MWWCYNKGVVVLQQRCCPSKNKKPGFLILHMANKYNKNVQARISESTADKFHKFCREEGETVSSRIRRLIIRELNNHSYSNRAHSKREDVKNE